jgi:hypothetical protein
MRNSVSSVVRVVMDVQIKNASRKLEAQCNVNGDNLSYLEQPTIPDVNHLVQRL